MAWEPVNGIYFTFSEVSGKISKQRFQTTCVPGAWDGSRRIGHKAWLLFGYEKQMDLEKGNQQLLKRAYLWLEKHDDDVLRHC